MTTLAWPLEGERVVIQAGAGPDDVVIVRRADGAVAGAATLGSESGGSLVIERLCIDTGMRGYGLGSEAARLVLDAATAAGYHEVQAWAPPDRGLAVYFWCRMGLRPVFGAGRSGGLEFVRAR